MDQKRVTYSMSEAEFRKGILAMFGPKVLMTGIGLMAMYNIWLLKDLMDRHVTHFWREMAIENTGIGILAICIMAWMSWVTVSRALRVYRLTPETFVDISWELQDGGLLYQQGVNRVLYEWKIFTSAKLASAYLILVGAGGMHYIIPRRAFTDGGISWHARISDEIARHRE